MPDYTMKNLYSQGRYEDAIAYASETKIRDGFTEWDYLFQSKCLYKLKRYSDYLELYKEFHAKFPDSDKLDDYMGWSLYHAYVRNFDFETGDRRQYLRQVDYILSHSTDSKYSPKVWVATVAADAVFKNRLSVNTNYELGNKYLSVIDPLTLDLTEREANVDGRIRKIESDREKWYRQKTKSLVELKLYEECLSYIDDAFQNVDHFHNNCNHWLNYRKALCLFALGDLDGAEKITKDILGRFEHWCFYELLFNIAVARGNTEEAIRYGAIGALVDREHKLRVSFYENYAEFLLHNGYPREAALHYKLVEQIRFEEGWKGIRLPEDFSYPEDVWSLDKKDVIRELLPFWRQEKERGIEFYEGTIDRILPNGKSGFIRGDNGSSYYFNVRDFTKRVNELQEGARVRYTLEERLDKSKNVMKPNAVQISFIR